MSRWGKTVTAGLCLLLAGMSILGAAAAPSSMFDARVSMDTVDIRVTGEPVGRTAILDDEQLPYRATICNAGQDCYVRIRGSVESDSGLRHDLQPQADDPLWVCMPDGWVYFKPVLADGDVAHLVFLVGNPHPSWDGKGMELDASITAQAIQASNFSPDYDSPHPWNESQTYVTKHPRESE